MSIGQLVFVLVGGISAGEGGTLGNTIAANVDMEIVDTSRRVQHQMEPSFWC